MSAPCLQNKESVELERVDLWKEQVLAWTKVVQAGDAMNATLRDAHAVRLSIADVHAGTDLQELFQQQKEINDKCAAMLAHAQTQYATALSNS